MKGLATVTSSTIPGNRSTALRRHNSWRFQFTTKLLLQIV